jgi:periplasmic protein TonB
MINQSQVVFLIAAAWLGAAPQADQKRTSEPDEHVYDLGADIAPPRVTRQVNPEYPQSLKGVRVEGTVDISVIVTSKGTPTEPKVIKSLEKDVDRCAIDAVRQWRFAPGKKDGKPVAVRVTLEITFHSL